MDTLRMVGPWVLVDGRYCFVRVVRVARVVLDPKKPEDKLCHQNINVFCVLCFAVFHRKKAWNAFLGACGMDTRNQIGRTLLQKCRDVDAVLCFTSTVQST